MSVTPLAKAYGLPIVTCRGRAITFPPGRRDGGPEKKLVMAALWTEVCLAFPALDALREGYQVLPVVDAVGGTSPEAHRAGLERIVQAGAQPIGWVERTTRA